MDYKALAVEAATIRNTIDKIKGKSKVFDPENGEAYVLSYLSRAKDEVNPKMIAKEMQISTARVAKLLSQLEEKDMIIRKDSEKDKRQIIVELLPNGRLKHMETRDAYYSGYERVLRALGNQDAKEYLRIQNRILNIIKEQKNSND